MIDLPRAPKPALFAMACMLPIALFLYEYLASQNGHVSLVEWLQALPNSQTEPKRAENKAASSTEATSPLLQKLSIKTTPDAAKGPDENQTMVSDARDQPRENKQKTLDTSLNQTRVKSLLTLGEVQKVTDDQHKADATKGNHAEGKLELPALKVDARWSSALISTLLREGKIRIVASDADGQYFDYKMKGTAFHQGSFVPLQAYDLLSDRRVLLKPTSGAVYHELMTAYKLSGRGAQNPSLMIRFTRQFNHEITQQQLALIDTQKTAKSPRLGQDSDVSELGTTVLVFSTLDGELQYTLSVQ